MLLIAANVKNLALFFLLSISLLASLSSILSTILSRAYRFLSKKLPPKLPNITLQILLCIKLNFNNFD
jgi:hypothetical protein